ncbi:unnamed protein product [Kuraishia capsulata CBS 1993]|uniref:Alpha-aminoadipate reductase n=1 Tax=Kuraishia capsulata CBS 1993 TaxID=1382522 RepID=W6MFU2_9ASCO|nr:uncharacterized protein KUCA_T00000233001 [Kuraishia capsulata CBS 1993]CDK24273.1 unnamed protein product [Kuraishia capsulata CBS 1993]
MSESLKYWASELDSPTLSVLPQDYNRPHTGKIVEATHEVDIGPLTGVVDTDESSQISGFTAALTVFAVLIYRLTGDNDIVIATDSGSDAFIVRVPIEPTMSFLDLAKSVSAKFAEGSSKAVPLSSIADYIQSEKKLSSPPPLFRLSFQKSRDNQQLFTAVKGSVRDLAIFTDGEKLTIFYNSILYKSSRLVIFGEQFAQFISQVNADPSLAIGKVNLITPSQKDLLPDPTANLDWSNFRGAIQDIFSDNAAKHPDRTCVVETKSFLDKTGKDRVFTYKQIDETSNIVGHYLVKNGIKRGDVVMIYAYRGVDLMVAVMGVLKAGATFSVIDPAYPPARQTIYLRVANPAGVIGIKKAGVLSELVEDYIRDELNVITRIPALQIQDDGSLLGGDVDGKDVLAEYEQYKSQRTGVLVGPDSNPTLSFTSGSEGIPKGVLGRHFSLAYYFPWMSKTFGLTENDKFTMLSGIAHDPIQRDMFTPLFLGAQLLVPTSDDIGTPGRLAEWMSEYGATVTHLTPAMGQLLSAQAVAEIPSLHHAFFVGDILTKRDCLRLQTLAKNVFIVNMYGTTETQRAVSYFEVASRTHDSTFLESQKDVMPAGKGMLNVQLLVVNRNDRSQTCGVGEVGEIYVRAAGLAEGYRNNDELNKEKFVTNWYTSPEKWTALDKSLDKGEPWRECWLGPRDRLYRTGDLGRYLPDGNCECSGRADDQVKIRGFRIELGEIDTHLSQHPLVRENVTLVRRDKNEEPILISFIVPKDSPELANFKSESDEVDDLDDPIVKGLVLYRELIKDLKAHLKKRLASYAVPTIIVPLTKLPLNPNGKVDKPKLPFPDTAQLAAVAKYSSQEQDDSVFTPLQAQIRDLWLDVLPQRPATVSPEDSFFDLGGHSILATRMIFELRKKLIVDLPLGTIFKHPTIAAFAAEVAKVKDGEEVQLATGTAAGEDDEDAPVDYSADAKTIADTMLKESYKTRLDISQTERINVLLTGATGFLGSYILRDLLTRPELDVVVYAHVRAKDKEAGLERVKKTAKTYGIWDDKFESRIQVVIADLAQEQFGLPADEWTKLNNTIDSIIHNGAMVHWVFPYQKMREANVISTVNLVNMAAVGKPKQFVFVSSTSTLDTEHYVSLADELVEAGKPGIPESDDLQGSAHGLGNGYGQTKWAAEYIVRQAGERGLKGAIVRPGYVQGDSVKGSSNTDDFLLRMLKGCVELGKYPDINNSVNTVPVDHVSRVVTACGLHPPRGENKEILPVVHVTGHPRIKFNEFLGSLAKYGYDVSVEDYVKWTVSLEKFVVGGASDIALFPLLHFVLDNLPQDTKAPELDDANAVLALKEDVRWNGGKDFSNGDGITVKSMGVYISYLIKVGFLPAPSKQGELSLPEVEISEESLQLLASGAGARSSAA